MAGRARTSHKKQVSLNFERLCHDKKIETDLLGRETEHTESGVAGRNAKATANRSRRHVLRLFSFALLC